MKSEAFCAKDVIFEADRKDKMKTIYFIEKGQVELYYKYQFKKNLGKNE
jgi:hypothetical protein